MERKLDSDIGLIHGVVFGGGKSEVKLDFC